MSSRDESLIRQQVADLRERAAHHEKEIPALEKTLEALTSEFTGIELAAAKLRDQQLVP